MNYYQLRDNNKRGNEVYRFLHGAAQALLEQRSPTAHVVQLDIPGGAVVRELTLKDCREIVQSNREINRSPNRI